jgi:3-hydroxyisobutyrate dehydrogenase
MKIGFVGLGTMGGGMVENLVAAGYRPLVWNRTAARAEAIEGVDIAPALADLAEQSEVVLVCVSDTSDVEEVAGTLLESMGAGIIVDHSTISPLATESLAKEAEAKGIEWLDAPVSGGSEGAARGALAVMVGGRVAALEAVRPYLETYSASIVHIGEKPGSGQMAKLVNQVLVVINQLAVSEALLMADAAGLDLTSTIAAVEGGAAGSWMLSNRGPQMVVRDWRPGFTIDLQQKDLRLVLDSADELGVPTPGTALVFQLYRALQSRGLGSEGNHALVKALEEMSGRQMGSAE